MKKFVFISLGILVLLIVVGMGVEVDHSNQDGSIPTIYIPSDSDARYEVVSFEKVSETERVLATKRIGSSGVSYSKIAIDCSGKTFQGLGEGDTLEEMNAPRLTEKGLKLVEGSIKYYQVQYACSQ